MLMHSSMTKLATSMTEATAAAIVRRFGSGAVDGKIQAHVVSVGA